MTDRSLLLRAAEIIDDEAQAVRDCHTTDDGVWPDDEVEVREMYEDMRAVAAELRREAGHG